MGDVTRSTAADLAAAIATGETTSVAVTVASYGGIQPSRIFEPTVVGTPLVVKMSFSARGTPASGPSFSPRSRFSSSAGAGARSAVRLGRRPR